MQTPYGKISKKVSIFAPNKKAEKGIAMMTLHIFNPEHDLALASHLANFTAPHAARELRSGLGFLPALWADDGDWVLVEDAGYAAKALEKLSARLGQMGCQRSAQVAFTCRRDVCPLRFEHFDVWGWDASLRNYLLRNRIADVDRLPSLDALDDIRTLSHRASAKPLLAELLKLKGTVGGSEAVTSYERLLAMLYEGRQLVIKAPWSSSGRGVRFFDGKINPHFLGWIKNMLNSQGCLMVEPYYRKVKDFGMEFRSDGKGRIAYLGLSLFHTVNGAYAGNILATERAKQEMLSRYVKKGLLNSVKATAKRVLGQAYKGRYAGPFGIDMMVVARDGNDGFALHPCVEINLRRTMGHVALCLAPADDDIKSVMRISTEDNYQLKILPL